MWIRTIVLDVPTDRKIYVLSELRVSKFFHSQLLDLYYCWFQLKQRQWQQKMEI